MSLPSYFMASNGLVTNSKKTCLLILGLNQKSNPNPITINIGKEKITQEKQAKLLGMTMDEKQSWTSHIHGKGGVIPSLNSRLFLIKRLKNKLNPSAVIKIADSIFNSKIRYGMTLLGKIRWKEDDVKPILLKNLQKAQNKMLRTVYGAKLKDKISSKILLTNIFIIKASPLLKYI